MPFKTFLYNPIMNLKVHFHVKGNNKARKEKNDSLVSYNFYSYDKKDIFTSYNFFIQYIKYNVAKSSSTCTELQYKWMFYQR